jgi:uncharacterized protein (TIGR02594 family)
MCQIVIPASEVPSPARPLEPTEIDRYFLPIDPNVPGFVPGAPDDLAGVGDFSASVGGAVTPIQPPANPAPAGTAYASIQQILEGNLNQNWREVGSPPNPNIAEAWGVAGGGRMPNDGSNYPWCGAFVTWVLWKSGQEHNVPGVGSQTYLRYGKTVDWRDFTKIRKYDLCVMTRREDSRKGHVCFVHSIDPANNKIKVFGGNQANNYKLSTYAIFRPQGQSGLYVNQIRRNWDIPEGFDLPLVEVQETQQATTQNTNVFPTDSAL